MGNHGDITNYHNNKGAAASLAMATPATVDVLLHKGVGYLTFQLDRHSPTRKLKQNLPPHSWTTVYRPRFLVQLLTRETCTFGRVSWGCFAGETGRREEMQHPRAGGC